MSVVQSPIPAPARPARRDSGIRLADSCEAFVLEVLSVNRAARGPLEEQPSAGSVRERLLQALADIESQVAAEPSIATDWAIVRPALRYFADEILTTGPWRDASNWARNGLTGDLTHERVGDEAFWELYRDALKRAGTSTQALEVFFILVGLGFEGRFAGNPTELGKRLESAAQILRPSYTSIGNRLCPKAYVADTRTIEVERWSPVLLVGAVALAVVYATWMGYGLYTMMQLEEASTLFVTLLNLDSSKLSGTTWDVVRPFLLLCGGIGAVFALYSLIRWSARFILERRFFRMVIARVAGSTRPGGVEDQQYAEMQRRFKEGVRVFQQRGRSLYFLPWFLMVGDSGTGKTHAIKHSGVDKPAGLNDEYAGVGGTINMDWWFLARAVILDTAGRIFSAVVPAAGDEWTQLLENMSRARPRQPLNGVLMAIPAAPRPDQASEASPDTHPGLIHDDEKNIKARVTVYRQRLQQISSKTGVQYPVWVIVTLCDRVLGFREFFESLAKVSRQHQIFGWSRAGEPDAPYNPTEVHEALDDVAARLRRYRMELLENPSGLGDRRVRRVDRYDQLFALPEEYRRLAPNLRRYLDGLFTPQVERSGMRYSPPMLRGVYFTSALQKGAPLSWSQRRDAGAREAELPSPTSGALFLKDLLEKKVFVEVGLVSRKAGLRKRRTRLIWGVTCAASVVVVGLIVAFLSLAAKAQQFSSSLALGEWATIKRWDDNSDPHKELDRIKQCVPVLHSIRDTLGAVNSGSAPNAAEGLPSRYGEFLFPAISKGAQTICEHRNSAFSIAIQKQVLGPLWKLANDQSRLKADAPEQALDSKDVASRLRWAQTNAELLSKLNELAQNSERDQSFESAAGLWRDIGALVMDGNLPALKSDLLDKLKCLALEVKDAQGVTLISKDDRDAVGRQVEVAYKALDPSGIINEANRRADQARNALKALQDAESAVTSVEGDGPRVLRAAIGEAQDCLRALFEETLQDEVWVGDDPDQEHRTAAKLLGDLAISDSRLRRRIDLCRLLKPSASDSINAVVPAAPLLSKQELEEAIKNAGNAASVLDELIALSTPPAFGAKPWSVARLEDGVKRLQKVKAKEIETATPLRLNRPKVVEAATVRLIAWALPQEGYQAVDQADLDALESTVGLREQALALRNPLIASQESNRMLDTGAAALQKAVRNRCKALEDRTQKARESLIFSDIRPAECDSIVKSARSCERDILRLASIRARLEGQGTQPSSHPEFMVNGDDEAYLRDTASLLSTTGVGALSRAVELIKLRDKYDSDRGPCRDSIGTLAEAARRAVSDQWAKLEPGAKNTVQQFTRWVADDVAGKRPFCDGDAYTENAPASVADREHVTTLSEVEGFLAMSTNWESAADLLKLKESIRRVISDDQVPKLKRLIDSLDNTFKISVVQEPAPQLSCELPRDCRRNASATISLLSTDVEVAPQTPDAVSDAKSERSVSRVMVTLPAKSLSGVKAWAVVQVRIDVVCDASKTPVTTMQALALKPWGLIDRARRPADSKIMEKKWYVDLQIPGQPPEGNIRLEIAIEGAGELPVKAEDWPHVPPLPSATPAPPQ